MEFKELGDFRGPHVLLVILERSPLPKDIQLPAPHFQAIFL
jgi:hypothetical protein